MGATRELAEFVAQTTYKDLPQEAVHMAKRCLLDWLGNTLAASKDRSADTLLDFAGSLGGPEQATVLGKGRKTGVLQAAFVNGYLSHLLDYDDTHVPTVLHPTSPVMPAVMAVAEHKEASGGEIIASFVLGVDVETRVALALSPSHYQAGWHITGSAGPLGAASAVGALLKLDGQRVSWAMGLAATQPVGLREHFGTMAKAFHAGRAAENGLLAAILADRGVTASENILEGPNGYLRALSTAPRPEILTLDLGVHFHINDISFKPYACGVVNHPLIDGMIHLRNAFGLTPGDVSVIEARMCAKEPVPQLANNPQPETGLSGKFSLAHCAAVALADGAAGPPQFTDERARDPLIKKLRSRFRVELRDKIQESAAYVAVKLKDGRRLEVHVPHATGTVENPMSDAALESKFRNSVEAILSEEATEKVVGLVWMLEQLEDVGEIMRLCR